MNIFDIIQLIFIKFHKNDRTKAIYVILVTDDLKNVGKSKNLQKKNHFWNANISNKNSQRKFLLTVTGNQNMDEIMSLIETYWWRKTLVFMK